MNKTGNIILLVISQILLQPIVLSGNEAIEQKAENIFFQTIRVNQDDSYITAGGGWGNIEPLIFEAKLAPYFLLRTSEDAKWGATISPTVIFRMYNEYSYPVRTPSYKPHITLYRQISGENSSNMNYVFLNFAHHSNGQDDNFFNDDGSVNTYSGDFSTDYLKMGAFFNYKLVPFPNTYEYFKTSVEYHVDLTRNPNLKDRYSFIRWNNSLRIFRFFSSEKLLRIEKNPRIQTSLKTTWLFGNINNASFFDVKERFNVSLTIAYRPEALTDVSLFVNAYSGKDYYNIYFDRRLSIIRFGIQAYAFR